MAKKLEYKWLVGIVFTLAMFMDLMDMTITNVAVPTLTTKFATTTTTIEWVITGYLLSLALFIPISGWLGDKFGTKRVFIAALGVFVLGSVLCGLSWSVESLIGFRVLQGVGGGMLTPVGMTMLFRAFPPSERAAASAVLAIPVTVAPAVGPLLGGYIVQYQDWRWIFFLNVVPGILALLASVRFLIEETQENPGKLDVRGFVLAGAGLISVMYALSEVGRLGFGDPEVIVFGLGGLALLALFTLVELRTEQPMLDVRLLTDKLFGASNFVLLVGNASIMGTFFLLPIFLQTQKGLSAFDVGLVTFPIAIGVALMAQPAAKLYPKIGPRRMMIVGFTGNMLMTAALALINYGTADWLVAANMFVRGLFLAFLFIPLQAATFATISPQDTGRASSIFSVSRQVAASIGVAILATALTSRLSFHHALLADAATRDAALSAFQDTFLFAGVVSILGIVACFLIDDEKAAEAAGMDFAGEGAPSFALEPANDWDAA
ncbi:MAG TPA: MDR family MFS transporter [Dehalococcoidia bacterium]|nr:MDR family MFS transporter [Dehalococcoidia bacterium]